jgi:DNA-binding IclR family transcriptional regulator
MPEPRAIKSAERTIALFELFSAMEAPLTVSEVSAGLDIPQSSTTMLLRNLTNIGYLDYDPVTRKYKPTIRILLLSSWITRRFGETGKIASALDRIHEETGEVVMLGIQHNAAVQPIVTRGVDRTGLQFSTPGNQGGQRFMIRSGLFASLTCSAMGRALLSLKPDAEARSWVRRANAEARDPAFRVSESVLLDLLGTVRVRGYAETSESQLPEHGAFAVCVPSPMDETPMAVSISLPVTRMASKRSMIVERLFALREQFVQHRLDEYEEWQRS